MSETAKTIAVVNSEPPAPDFRLYSLLSNAQNVNELKKSVATAFDRLGFDRFYFAPVVVDSQNQLSNWPTELLSQYNELRRYDLIASHADKQTKSVYHSTIAEYIENSPIQLESNDRFMEINTLLRQHGINDTYNIPYKTPMGISFLLSVAVDGINSAHFEARVKARQDVIYLFGDILTNLAISRHSAYFLGPNAIMRHVNVTPKQLQLLTILAKDNVHLQGAADQMCVSLDTANKHIAAIKEALGAKTQSTAVYRAIAAGLIDIDSREWD